MFRVLSPKLRATKARSFEEAVAVVAVPFNSDRPDGSSDESNKMISAIAHDFVRLYGLPVYAQRENARVLREYGIKPAAEYRTMPGQWVQSHVFIRWVSSKIAKGTKVILVCHPHHARRCSIPAEHYGLVPLVAPSGLVPYDPKGGQWWRRKMGMYLLWEYAIARPATFLYWLFGKL